MGLQSMLDAHLLGGLTDSEVEGLFRSARDADYLVLADDARALEKRLTDDVDEDGRGQLASDLGRLERRLEEISAIDFMGASGREVVHGLLSGLRARLARPPGKPLAPEASALDDYQGRTWVTRTGIHVDRIASAWLIRSFIDPAGAFKFVPAKGYVASPRELRFDMFEAEFSHEGELCTFEVLCQRFSLDVPGLRAIAELIHDIDLKDGKYGRPETPGLAAQIAGLCLVHSNDEARLARGTELFEELLAHFSRRRG